MLVNYFLVYFIIFYGSSLLDLGDDITCFYLLYTSYILLIDSSTRVFTRETSGVIPRTVFW